jgi:hypothetical protein
MDNRIIEAVRHFNTCTSFERVTTLNEWQVGQLTNAIDQLGIDAIKEAFDRAERSNFLSGRKTPSWKACFGWLIKAENIKNILNGKYDDYISARVELPPETFGSINSEDDYINAALARGFSDLYE